MPPSRIAECADVTKPPPPPSLSRRGDMSHFISGGGSAVINIIITFPINKVMFRQQLYGVTTAKALQQLTREGAITLYRGLLPPLVQKSASVSIMFGCFDQCQKRLHSYGMNQWSSTVVAGLMAGTIETVLTPLERVQTLLQDPRHHKTFRNTQDAFVRVVGQHGWRELYRGVSPILYRNSLSSALYFVLREPLHCVLKDQEERTTNRNVAFKLACNFASGAAIGAVCSTVFYPLNVIKTRMQSEVGGPYSTIRAIFKVIYAERRKSWRRLYRGIHLNLFRSALSWGIINAAYETLIHLF